MYAEMEAQSLTTAAGSDEEPPRRESKIMCNFAKTISRPMGLALVMLLFVGIMSKTPAYMRKSSTNRAQANVQDTIEAAESCSASQTYYAIKDHCKNGRGQLQSSCPKKYDRDCYTSVSEFSGNCNMYARECLTKMSRDCEKGKSSKYCKPMVIEHNCRYNATLEKKKRGDDCDKHFKERESKCADNKKALICKKWATHLLNKCTQAMTACRTVRCRRNAPADPEECKPYEEPQPNELKAGDEVKLEDGKRYKLLSANGCEWGGRYCLKALGTYDRGGRKVPKLMKHDEHAGEWRFVKTKNENEFVLVQGHESCKDGGPKCLPLSMDTTKCPESAWNKDYKNCVVTKLGGDREAFVFKNVDGFPDLFTLKNSKDWQLSTNEEDCWNSAPAVVVEELSFDYAWRVVPVD